MKLNPDDPQLTAYALGELEPGERAAVEAGLRDNPECVRAVEEIREAAGRLTAELSAEPCPELSEGQRGAIESRLQPRNVISLPRSYWAPALGLAALAACVAAVLAWQFWFAPMRKSANQQLAMTEQPRVDLTVTPAPAALEPRPVVVAPATVPQTPATPAPAPMPSVAPLTHPWALAPSTPTPAPTTSTATVESSAINNTGIITYSAPPAPAPTPGTTATTVEVLPQPSVQAAPASDAITRLLERRQADLTSAGNPAAGERGGTATKQAGDGQNGARDQDHAAAQTAGARPATPAAPVVSPAPVITSSGFQFSYAGPKTVDSTDERGGAGGGFGGGGGGGRIGGGSFGRDESVMVRAQPLTQQNLQTGPGSGVGGFTGRRGFPAYGLGISESDSGATVIYAQNAPPPDFGEPRYYRYPSPPTIEAYPQYPENNFLPVMRQPLSTFSADVDTASYANIRRFLNAGQLPPADAVRLEEMVNYFQYNYAKPRDGDPFAATIEVAGCPWNTDHRLVRVGLKGREIAANKRPASSFVFLIDISGSMATPERLPLIKQALRSLVMKMNDNDRVAIVVYAAAAGVRLPSTPCTDKEKILAAIDSLQAGGSTNGGDGIQQAYRVAQENFIEGGVNRVLLATDGDFNVGIVDQTQLVNMIKEHARNGVALTTLGVGTDNYKDALMQKLADSGHGNYYYLDTLEEAQKDLIDQMSGTLVTIAKDVKIQIEFNPAQVAAYRLIGYEKRKLRTEDFNNDAKSAGDIGAGHTVTALYEIVPAGHADDPALGSLRYQQDDTPQLQRVVDTYRKELLTLKLRYKQPDGNRSQLLQFPITDSGAGYSHASADFKFAAAVASFGMILRDSPNRGSANYSGVIELAREAKGADESGYRAEFINLVEKARELSRGR